MARCARLHWLAAIALGPAVWADGAAAQQPRLKAVTRAATATIEAESLLTRAHASAGAVALQDMAAFGAGWGGGAQLFWQPPAPQDSPIRNWPSLTVLLDVPGSGRSSLVLQHTVAPDYGTVRVFVDGQPRGDFIGFGEVVATRTLQLGEVEATGKPHQLVFTVFGKDPASTGYFVGLDRFELVTIGQAPAAGTGTPVQKAPGVDTTLRPGMTQPAAALVVAPKAAVVDCAADSCSGSIHQVRMLDPTTQQCVAWFVLPCFPYRCDPSGRHCAAACRTNAECATGAECNIQTRECGPHGHTCKDPYTARETDGKETSCVPYKCMTGTCRETCDGDFDCATGYTCVNRQCLR